MMTVYVIHEKLLPHFHPRCIHLTLTTIIFHEINKLFWTSDCPELILIIIIFPFHLSSDSLIVFIDLCRHHLQLDILFP